MVIDGADVRAAFACGRGDVLRMQFCGKIDLQDIALLCAPAVMGLCRVPRHLPPWVSDPRGVLAIPT